MPEDWGTRSKGAERGEHLVYLIACGDLEQGRGEL